MMRSQRKSIRLCGIVLLVVMMCSLTGCGGYRIGGKALKVIEVEELKYIETYYQKVMVVLEKGTVENLNAMSQSTKVTYEEAWEEWQMMVDTYGSYQSYVMDTAYEYGEDTIAIGYITLENGRIAVDVKMNEEGEILQMEIYLPAEEEEAGYAMPDTVEEIPVILGEEGDYPLEGIITMPKGARDSGKVYSAAVLIHGTGANDKDMTAGSTRMLRDMAWGLAQQGIITIRYDKRTYTYPEMIEKNPTAEVLSMEWTVIEDALMATEMLRGMDCVDPEQVYAVGHSIGGLILPRIDADGGNYAGYVLLAVPDTTWQETAYQQYLNYGLADMDADDIYYVCSYLESQKKDIDSKLDTYSEQELLEENLLGMPAQYWKSLNTMDYVQEYENTQMPVLILQGEADYQIRPDENYEGWQEKLEGHENVTMHLYEGLNHLFMVSQGCFMDSSMEYAMPNHVDEAVIADMAAFIVKE